MMFEEKGAIPSAAIENGVSGSRSTGLSEEKQIEELARAMCSFSANTLCRECSDCCFFKDYAKKAIEEGYHKQSENVIELPCKPGTILYFLYNSPYADKPDLTPRIYKTDDWQFEVDKTGIVITTRYIHSFNKKYDYYLGEAVFLTQEEAEQALEKMKGGAE